MKESIKTEIETFDPDKFYSSSLSFFDALGYKSTRKVKLEYPSFEGFLDQFDKTLDNIDPEKVKKNDWKEVQFLFQLTDQEILDSEQLSLINKDQVDLSDSYLKSYLFIALALENQEYTKTDLVNITRQINKQFKQPVLILFYYDKKLCLSIIDRRMHKKEPHKDVLEKVILIKDIRIENPHRAHLEILCEIGLENLEVSNFDMLHKALRNILDIQELNERFYKDLTKWFYYAIKRIKLPFTPDYYRSKKDHVKSFIVKLISRILFSWFLKEKGLINPDLLELYDYKGDFKELLRNENDPNFLNQNTYYRGILQTLFYCCLNTELLPTGHRNKKNLLNKFLPEDFDYTIFEKIPYLNGGLFEKQDDDNYNENIEDDVMQIPNELFYAKSITYTAGRSTIKTEGLNRILAHYKFTISENTPLEEEVALDPELLGLVFENLLAELDPDEQVAKNAKKEAGAYYTPRKIIDYMVNESLLLYLNRCAEEENKQQFFEQIKYLVYHEITNEGDEEFESFIVKHLDKIKVLDPACGSGAFPMGMLHRIVSILNLVDKDNKKWLHYKMEGVDKHYRKEWENLISKHMDDYSRKLGIIRDSIYGIDIEPLAIQLTKLRFFISLIIDQKVDWNVPENNYHIIPLPNLETKIICADSLQNLVPDFNTSILEKKLQEAKDMYFDPEITHDEKQKAIDDIAKKLNDIYPDFHLKVFPDRKYEDKKSQKVANIDSFKKWFHFACFSAPFSNFNVFFPELQHSGFDVVMGNPPYGGKKIENSIKNYLGLESKDPYGAFLARFIHPGHSPLVHKGILAFIVSDTYMTIKTHFNLRRKIMRNHIHKIIRVHPDTFKATVNTAISIFQHLKTKKDEYDQEHVCQMADLTNISIHKNYFRYLELLYETQDREDNYQFSSHEYAIYHYKQDLIKTNTHLPFFVGSSKLFSLMNNTSTEFEEKKIDGKIVRVRKIKINNKVVEVVRFGDIAEIRQGLATCDNQYYIYQNPEARGNYRSINNYREFILSEDDLNLINQDEELRYKIINKGFHKSKDEPDFDTDLWFSGKYIVPYDKGGESDTHEGWLPNYYVPTDYFIDWSQEAVHRLKTLTTKERNELYGKLGGDNRLCSRFQNK